MMKQRNTFAPARRAGRATAAISAILCLAVIVPPVSAQWAPHPTAGVPRTKDGKPNLNAPAPRAPDGKPDLSGVWGNPPCETDCPPEAKEEFLPLPMQFMDIGYGLKDGLPYRPWAAEAVKARKEAHGKENPDAHCKPIGIVQLHTHPYPRRVIQTPGLLAILNEKDNVFRQIFTDGRPLPVDPQPWWYGYSTGKWVGDTLVVQTQYFKDDGWLDFRGAIFTDAAKIIEKFRRPNYGNLEIELTIDDPKAYTKPWTVKVNQKILLNTDVFEFYCQENEKDVPHLR
jgi:hypothetical protein